MSAQLNCTLALLALINPISKMFILSTLSAKSTPEAIRRVSIKSSYIAAIILVLFALIGNSLLKYVFHVNIYSFQMVGGMVLLYRGFQALNKGIFFEEGGSQKLEDSSIVPLASPMIAGPATLTASISFPAQYGMMTTVFAVLVAVGLNLCFMFCSKEICHKFKKYNLMGASIRIIGLIVATIGAQMVLDGITDFVRMI